MVADDAESFRICLYGRLTGEYVPEVEKALAEQRTDTQKVVLDLVNVTFVDRAAMKFLCTAKSGNIAVENLPSYVQRWMEQEGRDGATAHPDAPEK
jgi:anti-anti-sigma regulatory factor